MRLDAGGSPVKHAQVAFRRVGGVQAPQNERAASRPTRLLRYAHRMRELEVVGAQLVLYGWRQGQHVLLFYTWWLHDAMATSSERRLGSAQNPKI